MMIKKIAYTFTILWSCATYPIVILVHGTFAAKAPWCFPTGDFYKILEEEAKLLGETVLSFPWSGRFSHLARLEAARDLAQEIIKHSSEKITIIGHSHGGNVIALASQLLSDAIDATKNPKDPFLEAQKAVIQYRGKLLKTPSQKEYLIDHVYLLATPINVKSYMPNMKVIKHLCNFYSKKDEIQAMLGIFGSYSRCFINLERAVNLQVIIEHDDIKKHPSHCQMRHPLIAQWILSIPFRLIDDKCISFDKFSWTDDGVLYFDKYNKPYYMAVKKVEQALQKTQAV